MQRITLSLTDDIANRFNELLDRRGYKNRSEAFRDLIRNLEAEEQFQTNDCAFCAAVVSYIYNHHTRQLASRMVQHQHEHSHLIHSVTHVHLSHDDCLETVILFGPVKDVVKTAEGILIESGIRNGRIHLMPVSEPNHATPYEHHHG